MIGKEYQKEYFPYELMVAEFKIFKSFINSGDLNTQTYSGGAC